jgi:hypothetical protein
MQKGPRSRRNLCTLRKPLYKRVQTRLNLTRARMIVSIPLLAASCITQPLPNSRCQEYQIAGDTEIISLGNLREELRIDVVGGDMPRGVKCRSRKVL